MSAERRSSRDDPPSVDVVLLDEDGSELAVYEPEDLELGEAMHRAGHWINGHVDYKAAPGPRLGPPPDAPVRRGNREDIMTPLAVAPERALAAVSTSSVVDRPLGPVSVNPDSCEAERGVGGPARLSFRATVRTGRFRRRSASLRLRPSPSNNLTIIELVPERRQWFSTKSFVRAGVPAVQELCARLTTECAPTKAA